MKPCIGWRHRWTKWGPPFKKEGVTAFRYQRRECRRCSVVEERVI